MKIEAFSPDDAIELDRRLKARGRGRKYDIDGMGEWAVLALPIELDGLALRSAVASVVAAGKRRGWTMVRVGTHRVVRVGKPEDRPRVGPVEPF
ncbi:MAG TPA: hypothetical protein VFH85_07680 [Gammaproteobacteria bacterium]|nr:hypothetical protein [Gammaproteobacteria bacterium]